MSELNLDKAFHLIRVGGDAQSEQENLIRAELTFLHRALSAWQKDYNSQVQDVIRLRAIVNEAKHEIERAEQTIRNISRNTTGDLSVIAWNESVNLAKWLEDNSKEEV